MKLRYDEDQPDNRKKLLTTAGILAAGLLVSGLLWIRNAADAARAAANDALVAVVEVEGKSDAVFSLDKNRYYIVETKNGNNTILIENGTVSVTKADCPNQICVNTKPISKPGETIVCLPHRMVVTISEKTAIVK